LLPSGLEVSILIALNVLGTLLLEVIRVPTNICKLRSELLILWESPILIPACRDEFIVIDIGIPYVSTHNTILLIQLHLEASPEINPDNCYK
jgi:hypothetical protein